VVRADGVVAHSGGKVVKNVAGYDLGKLFSGSQGTLGLITEATFRLHPLPAAAAWVTGDFGPSDRAGAAAAVAAAAGSALVPSAVELLWTDLPQVSVLLEGTQSGVAERARRMSDLLESAGAKPALAQVGSWETVPEAGAPHTVARVTFWVRQLGEVLDALAAAGASAGLRPAVSGPAGAGLLYACLDGGTDPDTAARFVRGLRDRLSGVFAPDSSGLSRGSMAVLAAPAAVLAAAGADRTPPGADLMRAVKDQFDPGHRMFPGRFTWSQ
jgi:glycolate oxidase FAD binding subunit